VLLGGHDRFEPVVVAGALTVLLGMALFAVIVFRTSGQQRAMPAAAEARARALHFENNA
jgi:F0F1-type ATP synthase assembly protein I